MQFTGFFTRSTPDVHIHQGGTTNTYCGEPLRLDASVTNVSWEQAAEATCYECHAAFFPAQWAAEDAAREHRYHTSTQWGR